MRNLSNRRAALPLALLAGLCGGHTAAQHTPASAPSRDPVNTPPARGIGDRAAVDQVVALPLGCSLETCLDAVPEAIWLPNEHQLHVQLRPAGQADMTFEDMRDYYEYKRESLDYVDVQWASYPYDAAERDRIWNGLDGFDTAVGADVRRIPVSKITAEWVGRDGDAVKAALGPPARTRPQAQGHEWQYALAPRGVGTLTLDAHDRVTAATLVVTYNITTESSSEFLARLPAVPTPSPFPPGVGDRAVAERVMALPEGTRWDVCEAALPHATRVGAPVDRLRLALRPGGYAELRRADPNCEFCADSKCLEYVDVAWASYPCDAEEVEHIGDTGSPGSGDQNNGVPPIPTELVTERLVGLDAAAAETALGPPDRISHEGQTAIWEYPLKPPGITTLRFDATGRVERVGLVVQYGRGEHVPATDAATTSALPGRAASRPASRRAAVATSRPAALATLPHFRLGLGDRDTVARLSALPLGTVPKACFDAVPEAVGHGNGMLNDDVLNWSVALIPGGGAEFGCFEVKRLYEPEEAGLLGVYVAWATYACGPEERDRILASLDDFDEQLDPDARRIAADKITTSLLGQSTGDVDTALGFPIQFDQVDGKLVWQYALEPHGVATLRFDADGHVSAVTLAIKNPAQFERAVQRREAATWGKSRVFAARHAPFATRGD